MDDSHFRIDEEIVIHDNDQLIETYESQSETMHAILKTTKPNKFKKMLSYPIKRLSNAIGLFSKTKIRKFGSSYYVMYGNYGGWGYSFGRLYNYTIQEILDHPSDRSDQPIDVTIPAYMDMSINTLPVTDPVDNIDYCFNLHDIDCFIINGNKPKFMKVTCKLVGNVIKSNYATLIYVPIMPFIAIGAVVYMFSTSRNTPLTPEQIEVLKARRVELVNRFKEETGVDLS